MSNFICQTCGTQYTESNQPPEECAKPFEFDRIYGAWWGKIVSTDAKAAVQRSADRYIRAIAGK